MTTLFRSRVIWTGFAGAPGVSTFYFLDVGTAISELVDMFTALLFTMPPVVHIHVEQAGDTIESTTGALVGTWESGPNNALVGTGPAPYAAPVGVAVTWLTDTILDSHRLRGRTFFVPTGANIFDNDGTLQAATLAAYQAAAAAFQFSQNASFVVWHRPFAGSPAVGVPGAPGYRAARPAHAGGHGLVTATRVADKAAVLRSRRD